MTMEVWSTGLHFINSVVVIELPRHFAVNGDVVVMETVTHIPFIIARVFVVLAPSGAIRGQHAHKQCAQFLTCPAGRVRSEEHTSELQSRRDLVCRLLLEK